MNNLPKKSLQHLFRNNNNYASCCAWTTRQRHVGRILINTAINTGVKDSARKQQKSTQILLKRGNTLLQQLYLTRMHSSVCPFAATPRSSSTTQVTAELGPSTTVSSRHSDDAEVSKDISDLPGPRGLPVLGNFYTYLKKENKGRMHLVQEELHKKYGKIFKEKWGMKWQVHVSDPYMIEEICRREGRRPNRPSIQSWLLYRTINNRPSGIMSAQKDEWHLYRTEFGKPLMGLEAVNKLIGPFNLVVDDFVSALKRVKNQKGDKALAACLSQESYKWSMEMAGTFLFETRLGCLGEQIPTRTTNFIKALQDMLQSSLYLIVGGKLHWKLNTQFWREHAKAWDTLFKIGKDLIDERVGEMGKAGNDNSKGVYLSNCLANKNVTKDQIFTNITELLFAGTETTSNSLCFLLSMMAENPEVQKKVYEEIEEVLQGRNVIEYEDLQRMKYVRCTIKENLRLFPIVTMNCRILEDDIVLGGYKIPKNTLFVMNHYATARSEELFSDAKKFLPERWMRREANDVDDDDMTEVESSPSPSSSPSSTSAMKFKKTKTRTHPFAYLPFGFGNRSCVGQQVAKAELMMALAKILQNFEIEKFNGAELKPFLRVFLTPGNNVPIVLKERKRKF